MGLTQVSTDGVKNDAITKTKIPANQIEASELADNAVDTNAIADQAVALSKLPHGDSNNNGKFLRANNGADPSFETVSIPAGTTINSNTNNYLITGTGTANELQGESELQWNGSNLFVRAGEATPASLNLIADQGDDNGDGWKIQSEQDENDLTFKSNISGSYVDKLKLKSNAALECQGDLSAPNVVVTGTGSVQIPDSIVHSGDTNTKIRFPANDNISMEVAGSELFRITPDQAHGSEPSIRLKSANTVDGAAVQTGGTKAYSSGIPRNQLNIMDYQAYNVTDNGGAIAFGARFNSSNAHTTMASIEGVKHNNIDGNYQGAIAFKTRNNNGDNVIRMRLTDNGLCFGTDTAAANALDDYEEGSWTPVLIGSSTAGTVSYTARVGKYVKIGKVVTWEFYIAFTSGNGSGTFHIGGLPFTISNNGTYPAVNIGYVQLINLRSDYYLTGLHASNNNYLYFYERPNGGGANLQPDYDGSGAFIMSGHYQVS